MAQWFRITQHSEKSQQHKKESLAKPYKNDFKRAQAQKLQPSKIPLDTDNSYSTDIFESLKTVFLGKFFRQDYRVTNKLGFAYFTFVLCLNL